jgi:hypothetical protein
MAKKNIQTQLDQLANFRGLLSSPKVDTKLRNRVIKSKVYDSRNKISAILVERLDDYPTTDQIIDDLNKLLAGSEVDQAVEKELLSDVSDNRDPAVRIIVENKSRLTKKIDKEKPGEKIIREALPTKSNNSGKNKYSSILLNIPTLISPKNANLEKTLLFMDMVPTHELSRCVPYVDIRMISSGEAVVNEKPNSLTLYKHLVGDSRVSSNTRATNLLMAAKDDMLQVPESKNTVAGMELFTSPQSLAPLASQGSTRQRRINSGGDIFRSFLTMTDISLNKSFSGGMIGFESGTMELILHDRANLADVADLINPEYYSRVRFELTYGWSHPDEVNNVYGQLIKSTRQTGLFQITKTTYTLDRTGQVKISVKFAAIGSREMTRVKISDADDTVRSGISEIQKLSVAIKELFASDPKLSEKTPAFKSVRASQLITAAKNPLSLMATDSTVQAQIVAFIKSIDANQTKSPEQFKKLRKNIKSVFGTNGKLQNARKAIDTMVSDRVKSIAEGPDPWIDQRLRSDSFASIVNERKFFLKKRLIQLIGKNNANSKRVPTNIGSGFGQNGILGFQALEKLKQSNASSTSKLNTLSPAQKAAAARNLAVATSAFNKTRTEALRIVKQLQAMEGIKKGKDKSADYQEIFQKQLKMVSLGKIINEFILKPLAVSDRFTEVQAVYYPLNAAAGRAGQKWKDGLPIDNPVSVPVSIGSYLVDYSLFKEELQHYTKRKGTSEIQANEFLGFLFNTFTDDVRSWMYGVSELYAPRGAFSRKKGAVLKKNMQKQLKAKVSNGKARLKQVKGNTVNNVFKATGPNGTPITIPPGETREFITADGLVTYQNISLAPLPGQTIEFPDIETSPQGAGTAAPKTKEKKRATNSQKKVGVNEKHKYRMGVDQVLNPGLEPDDTTSPRWKFKKPNVECIIESGTPRKQKGSEKPILRIHIYDRVASPYKTQQAIYKEALVSPKGILSDSKGQASMRALLKHADNAKAARTAGNVDAIPVNVDTIKQFFYDTTPSLIFGSNNSILLDAQLSSIDDGALETINISKNSYSPVTPTGVNDGGIPLRVSQAILDATLVGCPTLDLVQQYFIDFGTNTTLDALYSISSVEHQLAPGKFNTRAKFVPNDGWAEFITFRQAIGLDSE